MNWSKRTKRWTIHWVLAAGLSLAALALLLVPDAGAQTGGVYSLRGTIASGGVISGGGYQLSTAIGQVTGGGSSGGVYTLRGQVLSAATAGSDLGAPELTLRLFMPYVER